jgi:ribosomal protein L29|tara:strand:+ start:1772 stop:1993 length:222 start_codon:yes stop_codon:yes gene_type:complete
MNIEELRKLETEELVKEKLSVIKNMMEKRFNHKSMQLSDTSQINKLRKDKAKILTVINERKILAKLEITEEDS